MIVYTRYLTPSVLSSRLSARIIRSNVCALPFPPEQLNIPTPLPHDQD